MAVLLRLSSDKRRTRRRRLIGTLNHGAKRAETWAPFTVRPFFSRPLSSLALTHCKWTRFLGRARGFRHLSSIVFKVVGARLAIDRQGAVVDRAEARGFRSTYGPLANFPLALRRNIIEPR